MPLVWGWAARLFPVATPNMKFALLILALLPTLLMAEAPTNILKNGDFETGPDVEKIYGFYNTPPWYNLGAAENKQGANARVTEGAQEGSKYSATVNDAEQKYTSFLQKTGHTIQEGEVFELSLDWVGGWKWQSQDILRVVIFTTTTNTLGGQKLWEETIDFERAPKGTMETVTHTFPPAPADADGSLLFFLFYGVDPAPSEAGGGFARVDNIVLSVKTN